MNIWHKVAVLLHLSLKKQRKNLLCIYKRRKYIYKMTKFSCKLLCLFKKINGNFPVKGKVHIKKAIYRVGSWETVNN